MIKFVWRMYLTQLRNMKKVVLVAKIIFFICIGIYFVDSREVNNVFIIFSFLYLASLSGNEVSKLLYIVPKNKELLRKYVQINFQIRRACSLCLILLANVTFHYLLGKHWDTKQIGFSLLFFVLLSTYFVIAYLPVAWCDKQGRLVGVGLSSLVIDCIVIIGYQKRMSWALVWFLGAFLSLILNRYYVWLCCKDAHLMDYEADRKRIMRRDKTEREIIC